MLGLKFIKSNPTTHLIAFRGGRIVRQGTGLALLYYAPTTSLVAVPIESREVPFIFEKVTSDYDVAPDGRRFLIIKPAEAQPGRQNDLRIVLNWFEELRRRVPLPK